ncbi:MAG: Ig-like domain-containing protein, partial [Fibrobacteraceae bacterium]
MMGLKRVSSFQQWNLVGLVLVLLCSNAFAAKVAPLYFESLGASSSEDSVAQQEYWVALMKYKLWGTHGILFNKEKVTIREQSGYTGTASGNVTFNNGHHTLGGPILVGGDLQFSPANVGMANDTLLGGPVRVLGNVTKADYAYENIATSKYEGPYCVQGGVKTKSSISGDTSVGVWVDSLDAFYGSALSNGTPVIADGVYADCPSTGVDSVPHVDTFLSVPQWTKPDSVPWGAEVLVSNMTTSKIAYIQVSPEDTSVNDIGVYDLYLESIRMKGMTGLKVYVLMPPGGRLTRILLRDTLEIDKSVNDAEIRVIYVNEAATFNRTTGMWTWDSTKATYVSNAEYAGNLLIYSPKGINWNEMIDPVFQGTYMTPGTFTLKDHLTLAGQLIADSLHFESDITGDFRYVPFDPPVITLDDPSTGTLTTLIEGNSNPQNATFYFRDSDGKITPIKTNVSFSYCFNFQDTVGMDSITKRSYAVVEDLDTLVVEGLDTLKLPLCASGDTVAITVSAGKTSFTISSAIYNDNIPENEYEKFSVYFSNLTGAVLAGNQREGSVTLSIKDNDSAPIAQDEVFRGYEDTEFVFSADSFSANMPIDSIRVITLPSKSGTIRGSFYLRDTSGTITPVIENRVIATADLATLYFLASPDEYDSVAYASFTFQVMSAEGVWSIGTNLATIQIMPVNDAPTITLGADSVVVLEDTGLVTLANWVTMTTGAINEVQTLTATIVTDNNTLFSVMPHLDVTTGTLTFTPAPDSNGVAHLTVKLCDSGSDSLCVDSLFTIKVTPVNDAPAYVLGPNVTVKEDSGAVIDTAWATAISKGPANESSQTLTFTLTTSDSALFAVQPAVDSTGKLTFTTARDSNGVATISIRLQDNGDTLNGGVDITNTQTFMITITSVDDPPTFVASTVRSFTVLEDAVPQSIAHWATLISSGAANESSEVLQFVIDSISNASLFSAVPALDSLTGNLTYTAAPDSNGSAFVVVKLCEVANPSVCSDTASFTINVTPVNDAPSYVLGPDVTVKEDSGAVSIAAWATAISKGPANESSQTLTFTLTTPDSALFAVQPAVDSTGKLTFTTASDANGVATIFIRLQDNGDTLNGGIDITITQTFKITITSEDDPPTFVASSVRSFTVLEDAVAQSIAHWATLISSGTANESSEILQFVIDSISNPSLFSAVPALDALTGNLTYTAAPDSNGSAFVVVKLCEVAKPSVCSDTASFTINVTPVNDAPSYVLGPNVTVKEDSGAVSISAWATAISKGPANESSQTLTFTLTTPDSAWFAVQPAVDSTGKLTFTTAPDANGVSTISIRLQDNGRVANGGVNTTITKHFTITITAENDTP